MPYASKLLLPLRCQIRTPAAPVRVSPSRPSPERESKKIADNHREFHILTEEDSTAERTSRELFATAYKRWMERQMTALMEAV